MIQQNRLGTRSPIINVMSTAIFKAARRLTRDFGELEHLQVSRKSLGDFVSSADLAVEKVLIEELSRARPGFSFLLEESGVREGKDPNHRWIIDPLDGTTNFLHGVPHFSISVALEKQGEITAGIVYNPITDEMFWAEKGGGAYVNQRRLRVSGRKNLDECLVATGTPYGAHGDTPEFLRMIKNVMPFIAGIRRFGSAALDLAYVAAGRFDAYFEKDISPWDVAAGIIIVKEAGGTVSEISGKDDIFNNKNILAANLNIVEPLRTLLNKK